MLVRLLIAFIFIPFIELVLLLRMADATSWLTTLGIVVATGILGSILARREGLAAFARFREAMGEGRIPGKEIQDGMMIAFAAALLLTPGLLTDGFGFFLLIPQGRRVVGNFLRRRYAGKFQVYASGFGGGPKADANPTGQFGSAPRRGGSEGFTVDSPSFGPKQRESQAR